MEDPREDATTTSFERFVTAAWGGLVADNQNINANYHDLARLAIEAGEAMLRAWECREKGLR